VKRILIVDDERLIRYSLEAVFGGGRAETVTAADGRGASLALASRSFDFCFLDIQLPDASGIDVMRSVRQLSPRTKIILMSGSEVDAKTMKAIHDCAYLFLSKPFDLYRVKRVLEAVPDEEKNVFQELSALEARLATERRRHGRSREEPNRAAYFTSAGEGEEQNQYSRADLIDISDEGTCIRTTRHLEPGSRIRFRNGMRNAAGIVRWSVNDEQNRTFVAGIQFTGGDTP
jgi:CheY-like chemotaxis protein